MTRWFGSVLVVIPNLVRDLGFEFWVLKPRPVGGVLYSLIISHSGFNNRVTQTIIRLQLVFATDPVLVPVQSETIRTAALATSVSNRASAQGAKAIAKFFCEERRLLRRCKMTTAVALKRADTLPSSTPLPHHRGPSYSCIPFQ
jgi:hypothetical protein